LAAASRQDPVLVFVEIAFVIFVLQIIVGREILFSLYVSGASVSAMDTDPGNRDGSSNLLSSGPLLLCYIGCMFFLIMRRLYVPLFSKRHLPLFLLLVFIVFSAAWSDSPSVSLRRSISLVGTTLVAAYIALAFPPRVAMRLMAVSLALFCVVSLALALGVPSIGRHTTPPHTGLWNGMQLHKNEFARDVVVTAVVFLLYLWGSRFNMRRAPILLFVFSFFIILLIGAWSGTSLIVFFGLIACFFLLRHISGTNNVRFKIIFIGFLFSTFIYTIIMYFFDDILRLLGKDPTFSGRTGIWEAAFGLGLERPFIGYGYRTFWVGESAAEVYRRLGAGLQHVGGAHNGYLDLWLETGLVGVLLVMWIFGLMLWRGIKVLAADADALNMLPVMFLALVVVYAVSAGVIAEQAEMAWVVLMIAWFWLANKRLPVARSSTRAEEAEVTPAAPASGRVLRRARPTTDLSRRWRKS